MAYYSNFGEQNIGRLDPKTGKVTEFALPELKKGWPQGSLGLRADRDGNLWLGMMYQGAVGRFDPKTEKVTTYPLPPEMNKDMAQVNMVRAEFVRGRRPGVDAEQRLRGDPPARPRDRPHRDDRAVQGRQAGREPQHLRRGPRLRRTTSTSPTSRSSMSAGSTPRRCKITFYELPTKKSAPRRGMMDAQDRMWFGEYRGNRIAMFDTKAEKFTEWELPLKWSAPYDVTVDKNGEAWTGSMMNDRVTRLDPKTGTFVNYLLPRETNIRRVFVDNSTTPVTFWVGNNHGGSIVKLEPLN